jgi:hypothetical protein
MFLKLHFRKNRIFNFLLACSLVSSSYAQTPFSCSGLIYQVSGEVGRGNVDLYSFNINTGIRTLIAPLGRSINAIGYNTIDNMIWGYDQNSFELVRIDALGTVTAYTVADLPTDIYNSADFLPGGYMLFYRTDTGTTTTTYYVVDLNPARPTTYLKLVDPSQPGFPLETAPFGSTMSRLTLTNDMAYNPTTGLMVGLGTGTNLGKIVTLNPGSGAVTVASTRVTGDGIQTVTGAFGATFVDAGNSNILYVFSNSTGAFFRVDLAANTATRISTSLAAFNNDGASCPSAVISYPISGNVFNDANGMQDITVNGTGTNVGGLTAVLYNNTTGEVEGIDPVGTDGSYNFGATPGNSYSIYLTTSPATIGQTSMGEVTLPTGWVNTGEFVGSTSGSDALADGVLTIGTVNAAVTNANFGIERTPESATQNYVLTSQPSVDQFIALDGTVPNVQPLAGSDPEDMPTTGSVSGKSIRIESLPTNGQLYYGGSLVTAGTIIENLDPSQLQIKLTQGTYSSTSFTWAHIDAAGQADPSPGTYTLSWGAPLPVRLVSFEATKEAAMGMITWATTEEVQSSYFAVERSRDGKEWTQIGQVKSFGESQVLRTYQFRDDAPLNGENLYRLRMVDNDGSYSFTRVVSLSFEIAVNAYVYPNPTTQRIQIDTDGFDLKQVRGVAIYDTNGRLMHRQASWNSEGLDVSNFQVGTYAIKITLNSGEAYKSRFVVIK